jgi:hypothetical protein
LIREIRDRLDRLETAILSVAGRRAQPAARTSEERDRGFADSPLEESGFEPLVPLTPKRERCRFVSKWRCLRCAASTSNHSNG